MGLMLLLGIAWLVLALTVAMMIGRAIRAADARAVTRTNAPPAGVVPQAEAQVFHLSRSRTLV